MSWGALPREHVPWWRRIESAERAAIIAALGVITAACIQRCGACPPVVATRELEVPSAVTTTTLRPPSTTTTVPATTTTTVFTTTTTVYPTTTIPGQATTTTTTPETSTTTVMLTTTTTVAATTTTTVPSRAGLGTGTGAVEIPACPRRASPWLIFGHEDCREETGLSVPVCTIIPTNAKILGIRLLTKWSDAQDYQEAKPGVAGEWYRFGATGPFFVDTPKPSDRKQVCWPFVHWSSDRARTARIEVSWERGRITDPR